MLLSLGLEGREWMGRKHTQYTFNFGIFEETKFNIMVFSVIGLVLDMVGVIIVFYFDPKPIDKIEWDFSEYDKSNKSGMMFRKNMGVKDENKRQMLFMQDSINETIKQLNNRNKKRQRMSIVGLMFLLVGFGLQIIGVYQ